MSSIVSWAERREKSESLNVMIYKGCFYLHNQTLKKNSSNEHFHEVDEDDAPQNDFICFSTIQFCHSFNRERLKVKKKQMAYFICIKCFSFFFCFFFTLLCLLPFHRKLVCLSGMKNRLKLLQRISFLRFAIRSFIFLVFFLLFSTSALNTAVTTYIHT